MRFDIGEPHNFDSYEVHPLRTLHPERTAISDQLKLRLHRAMKIIKAQQNALKALEAAANLPRKIQPEQPERSHSRLSGSPDQDDVMAPHRRTLRTKQAAQSAETGRHAARRSPARANLFRSGPLSAWLQSDVLVPTRLADRGRTLWDSHAPPPAAALALARRTLGRLSAAAPSSALAALLSDDRRPLPPTAWQAATYAPTTRPAAAVRVAMPPHLQHAMAAAGSRAAAHWQAAGAAGVEAGAGRPLGVAGLPGDWFLGGVALTGAEWRARLGDSVRLANRLTAQMAETGPEGPAAAAGEGPAAVGEGPAAAGAEAASEGGEGEGEQSYWESEEGQADYCPLCKPDGYKAEAAERERLILYVHY